MAIKLKKTKERAMKKKTAPSCNEDCFNCIYPDCIFDGLGRETKKGRAPKAAVPEGELTKDQIRSRKYYAAHREEQKAKKYAYYLEHREELNAKKREKNRAQKAAKAEAVNNNSIL